MTDTDLAGRVAMLEERIRELEDRAAIVELIASYGPAADRSDGPAVRAMFTDVGTYELERWFFTHGTMEETVTSDLHARFVAAGSAHVMSLPTVELLGDRAVAHGYSRVYVAHDDHWRVDRCSYNRWDLVRTDHGWKVDRRVNRVLNGSETSHALLAGVEPPPVR